MRIGLLDCVTLLLLRGMGDEGSSLLERLFFEYHVEQTGRLFPWYFYPHGVSCKYYTFRLFTRRLDMTTQLPSVAYPNAPEGAQLSHWQLSRSSTLNSRNFNALK
jgi:hypothetical protein